MADFNYVFRLNGNPVPPFKEWMDLRINAYFEQSREAIMDIGEITLVPAHFEIIDDWLRDFGPFQGCPFEVSFLGNNDKVTVFDGFLDFTEYTIVNEVERKCKLGKNNSLDTFMQRLDTISLQLLTQEKDSNGNYWISPDMYTDVPVIIKKRFDATEVGLLALSTAFIASQVYSFTKDTNENLLKKLKTIISPPAGKPAELFETIAMSILIIAYAVSMAIAIKRLAEQIRDVMVGRKTTYKGITLKKGMERICAYLGYDMDCDIPEMDWVLLPSKSDDRVRKNKADEGIPNYSDSTYLASGFYGLIKQLFLTKSNVRLINGRPTVFIRSEKSDYWHRNSTYVLPDVLDTERFTLNVDEAKANYLISFAYDPQDEYTFPAEDDVADFQKSNNYQVISDIENKNTLPQARNLRGLEEISIPCALPQRRNKLSVLEQALRVNFVAIDALLKLFGAKTINQQIKEHRGHLVISQANFSVQKLIKLENGLIPNEPARHIGAKYLYDNYHYWKNFKDNPRAQHLVYREIKIPFDFEAFVKTSANGTFTTANGGVGKFTDIQWTPAREEAQVSFYIEQEYTRSITATPVES